MEEKRICILRTYCIVTSNKIKLLDVPRHSMKGAVNDNTAGTYSPPSSVPIPSSMPGPYTTHHAVECA